MLAERYFNVSRARLFAVVMLAHLLLIWLSRSVLVNDVVFYNTYSDQLTYERSLMLFENMNRVAWVSYVLVPIILLLKFVLISLAVFTGAFFLNLHDRASLGGIFRVVIGSEVIFIIAGFVKFFWFSFFAGNYDLNDMTFFYPLSLINFFSREEVSNLWITPLQILNLFQILYILLLSHGLAVASSIKKRDAEKIVLWSYLPGLIFWIALIMFLTMEVPV